MQAMMTDDLPTPRSIAAAGFRVHIWCKSCRHAKDADLGALIEAGRATCHWCGCAGGAATVARG
jgi:hypothetical protein